VCLRFHAATAARTAAAAILLLGVPGAPAVAGSASDGFADLAQKLTPAVVNIAVMRAQSAQGGDGQSDTPLDEFFKDFFGDRGGSDKGKGQGERGDSRGQGDPRPSPGMPSVPGMRVQSLGSGFIIDPAGLIVTNNHVVADADRIAVTLQDDTNLTAEVVGRDSVSDLALLKVTPKSPLPAVVWGDSGKAHVGDWVLAIGDPFGLGGSVTAGILSARAREISASPYDDFLQTDAAINRGNSGGPMFNMAGEVIGINTAIYSPSGGSIGIGFAIPSNAARPLIEQLRQSGKVERGWLGIHIQAVTPEIAESLGLDKVRGALVADVDPAGPAAAAQIQPGDVILSYDGKAVEQSRRLPRLVAESAPGKQVTLTVWRDGHQVDAKATLAALEARRIAAEVSAEPEAPVPERVVALGLSLARVTPELRKRYALGDGVEGVVVVAVAADAPAAQIGVTPGDILATVGRAPVATPAEVVEKVDSARQARRKAVLLRLERRGSGRYVAVPVDQG
jgi:serine protease Do